MKSSDLFASRWGIIFAGLGMAVGTGNLWRFPRIVAQYGGGAFIIPWMIFLFMWSIPLLIIELSIGRKTRRSVVGSFRELAGEKYTWMGMFVAFVPTAITFYYAVVAGWCLKYFFASTFHGLIQKDTIAYWRLFSASWEPLVYHIGAIALGCFIIYSGIVKGIERTNKILIPALFGILIISIVRVLTLPGAGAGLNFLFSPNLSLLGDYRVWLNALSQSAWSTGAGWGLILTYAIYSHRNQNPVRTAATLGFGDNTASLLAATLIVPTVFAYFAGPGFSQDKVMDVLKTDNLGLTFIWIPQLFAKIPGGAFFLSLFFLALCFAAITSLISQLELIASVFIDAGFTRKKAVITVGVLCTVMGLPSAMSLAFFNNQDWVWGLGLMVNGLFLTFLVLRVGPRKFREEIISTPECPVRLGRGFDFLVGVLLPVQVAVMLGWWFYSAYSGDPENWLKIFSVESLGTVFFQWAVAIAVFLFLNKTLNARFKKYES